MGYLLRRAVLTGTSLILFSIFSFALVHSLPGGPFEALFAGSAGKHSSSITETDLQALAVNYGFDRPLVERYGRWLRGLASLELGESIYFHEPVREVLARAIPKSLILGLSAILIRDLVAFPLAVFLAVFREALWAKMLMGSFLLLHSLPTFLLGLLLLYGFSITLPWFPLQMSADVGAIGYLLPIVTLFLGELSPATFYLRNAVLEEMRRPYVLALYTRGVSRPRILFVHVLRNVGVSYVSHFDSSFAHLFSGTLLVETVFGIQGVGRLAYDSFLRRDYPVMLGLILLLGVTGIVANALADLMYRWIDPRVRMR